MSRPSIVVADAPNEADRDAILRALIAYNDAAGGPSGFHPVAVLVQDPDTGETCGGLWGRIVYDWLLIELLAIPEAMRHQHLGSDLLARAEDVARARNCAGVWLDTYAFQAPDFYRRHGYEQFGVIDDHPRGGRRFFFKKTL